MTNKLKLTFILAPFLFVIWLIGCSESPDPVVRPPYYARLDELHDGYFNIWQPYRPRPGYNKVTYMLFHEPLNLRVTNISPNDTTRIIGWRLDKTKGWWSNEYRDLFLLEVEYHCESYYDVVIQWGFDGSDAGQGSAGHGLICKDFEY